MSNVVHIGFPPLTDIPACLRFLADNLEERNDVASVVIAVETYNDNIEKYNYGEVKTRSELVGILTRAAIDAKLY